MYEREVLRTVKPFWLNRGIQTLAKGSSLKEDLHEQLDQFFNLLERVVETGDPSWLDPILSSWSSSLTQTDLESTPSNLAEFISELHLLTIKVCKETVDEGQALNLVEQISPWFDYCLKKATQYEIQYRISYVTEQLSQAQGALEKLDRSKSDFISIAAHELKTPLTLIEGYASMLTEKHTPKEKDSPDSLFLNGIHSGIQRMRTIIDDMIDVSLIDNNLLQLNIQPVWLNRIFAILRTELETVISSRNQTLVIDSFHGSDHMIFADPERLLQAFRNVLTNAVKYTPDGGKMLISGRLLPGFIETTITDNGIGIAPEDQPYIFEKFSRVGNTSLHSSSKTKFKGGGPGLGLHIAKGIIEAHGGAIWVESPGYDERKCPGAMFHVILPTRLEPADEKIAKLFGPLTKKAL